jgi:hypothetical protein
MQNARSSVSTFKKRKHKLFCDFISLVKYWDRYALNLSRCIVVYGCKLQRLKTYDCHILLQRVLSVCLHSLVDKEIYTTIAKLGNFFWQLCCKTLKLDVLQKFKIDIPIICASLRKFFLLYLMLWSTWLSICLRKQSWGVQYNMDGCVPS